MSHRNATQAIEHKVLRHHHGSTTPIQLACCSMSAHVPPTTFPSIPLAPPWRTILHAPLCSLGQKSVQLGAPHRRQVGVLANGVEVVKRCVLNEAPQACQRRATLPQPRIAASHVVQSSLQRARQGGHAQSNISRPGQMQEARRGLGARLGAGRRCSAMCLLHCAPVPSLDAPPLGGCSIIQYTCRP